MATLGGLNAYRPNIQSRALKRVDWWLIIAALVLVSFGLLALHSFGFHSTAGNFFKKQAINIGVGLVPATIFATVNPKVWMRSATLLYLVNLVALVAIFASGKSINGAARWINLGPLQFQPSEMAKLISILTVASFYAMRQDKIKNLSTFLLGLAHIAVPMVLILKQPHFGGALVLGIIWLSVSLVANVPVKFLATTAVIASLFLGFLVTHPELMPGYHGNRLKAWQGGASKRAEAGILYQTNQAQIAFGVGGVVGTGIGNGLQGENIPEQETDFVFTIIGEELGLMGCSIVLASFAFLFYRIWLVMYRAEDPFFRMIAAGVLGMFAFHTFVNLFMVTQMLPVIGLWLPFFSYGGTAMWLCMSAVGLVVNIRSREKPILF